MTADLGLGALWEGAGSGRWQALGECARRVTEPPPTRLAPWHSAALFTSSDFFFFFVPGQSCSDLTTGRVEKGGSRQETVLGMGGIRIEVCYLKGEKTLY